MFLIVGSYMGNAEVIDRADEKKEAQQLKSEYDIAFGNDWNISIVSNEEE